MRHSTDMNNETQQRLQAWFDNELDAAGAREVEALLERDAGARAHVEALRRTRAALTAAHRDPELPAPGWDDVAAGMDFPRQGRLRQTVPFPRMIGAVAAIMLLGVAVWLPFRQAGQSAAAEADMRVGRVELVETDLEGATSIVFLDQPSGWTVVWILEAEDPGEI
jgi:anti-sigma factor RsiW